MIVPSLASSVEGMDDTRVELNLLDGSGDNGQSNEVNVPLQQQNADNQQIIVVDLSDDNSNDQKDLVAGTSGQADGSVPQIMITDAENGTVQ